MTDSSPTTLSAAALQRHFEDRVISAIHAGDYSKPDTWFALNARMAFSMARKVQQQAERNEEHRRAAARALSQHRFFLWRSQDTLQSANVGADSEERL